MSLVLRVSVSEGLLYYTFYHTETHKGGNIFSVTFGVTDGRSYIDTKAPEHKSSSDFRYDSLSGRGGFCPESLNFHGCPPSLKNEVEQGMRADWLRDFRRMWSHKNSITVAAYGDSGEIPGRYPACTV